MATPADPEPCPRCGHPLRHWRAPGGALLRLCGVAGCRYGALTPADPRRPDHAERALAAALGVALAVPLDGAVVAPGAGSGVLRLDPARSWVYVDGAAIVLTPTEYRLLATLAAQPGRYLTTAALAEVLVGVRGDPRAVKVFIARLRRKLGDSAAYPRHIQTARGVGYRLLPVPAP